MIVEVQLFHHSSFKKMLVDNSGLIEMVHNDGKLEAQ